MIEEQDLKNIFIGIIKTLAHKRGYGTDVRTFKRHLGKVGFDYKSNGPGLPPSLRMIETCKKSIPQNAPDDIKELIKSYYDWVGPIIDRLRIPELRESFRQYLSVIPKLTMACDLVANHECRNCGESCVTSDDLKEARKVLYYEEIIIRIVFFGDVVEYDDSADPGDLSAPPVNIDILHA